MAKDENDKKYRAARKRVEDIKGFYIHFMIYIVVNLALAGINLVFSSQTIWFVYPAIGWGIALVVHFLAVFVFEGVLGYEWEEKQIEKMMKRIK